MSKFVKPSVEIKDIPLISILEKSTIENEIKELSREQRILFTSKGGQVKLRDFLHNKFPLDMGFIVGCFSHGSFSAEINSLSTRKISISKMNLDAWTVLGRIVYEREISVLHHNGNTL